jgi:hypothetical protein
VIEGPRKKLKRSRIINALLFSLQWYGAARRRWMDNIKMDLREIGWEGVDWIDMA